MTPLEVHVNQYLDSRFPDDSPDSITKYSLNNKRRDSRLPQELVDVIIKYAAPGRPKAHFRYRYSREEKKTLQACALVCRSWIPVSRSLLFAKLSLGSFSKADELLNILQSPLCTFRLLLNAEFVLVLGVSYASEGWYRTLIKAVDKTIDVKRLTILNTDFIEHDFVDNVVRTTVMTSFQNITSLHISCVVFAGIFQSIQLLRSFPRLNSVIFQWSRFLFENQPPGCGNLPPQLNQLCLHQFTIFPIMRWLLSQESDQVPLLASLRLYDITSRDVTYVAQYISASGQNITIFYAKCEDLDTVCTELLLKTVHFENLVSLTSFFLELCDSIATTDDIISVMSRIGSDSLENLIIVIPENKFDNNSKNALLRLDNLLSGSKFRHLKQLTILSRPNGLLSSAPVAIFPKCSQRTVIILEQYSLMSMAAEYFEE